MQTPKHTTDDELRALPPMVPFYPVATSACGVARSKGYELYRAGEFPVPVLTVGKRLKCRRVDLLRYLGIDA